MPKCVRGATSHAFLQPRAQATGKLADLVVMDRDFESVELTLTVRLAAPAAQPERAAIVIRILHRV